MAMDFDFSGGFIGIVNFGFIAFIWVGAYTAALFVIHFGISPWLGLFIGILPSAFLGFFIGIVSLRLRGMFAICLTWFFGLAMMGLATKMVFLTRGPLGLRCPPLFDGSSNINYYYTALIMMIISYFVLKWVTRSYLGLAFRAISQNMEAAKTSGIYPPKYRVINFTLSCALAGWFGGFYAYYYGVLTPDLLSTNKTVEILVISYIGGRGSLWGGIVAAFPFVVGMEIVRSFLSNMPGLNLIIYGLFLILTMIYYPGGIVQLYKKLLGLSRNRLFKNMIQES